MFKTVDDNKKPRSKISTLIWQTLIQHRACSRGSEQVGFPEVVFSPAKVNLRLKVIGRRPDGYHLLSMINVQVAFFDRIIISLNNTGEISIDETSKIEQSEKRNLLNPELNIATKVLKEFLNFYRLPFGARIKFEKNIPTGAGLAGGSSNAGEILRWAGARFRSLIDEHERISNEAYDQNLINIAVKHSADAPFFIKQQVAKISGIGERIEPIPYSTVSGRVVFLFFPSFKLYTPQVFKAYRERFADNELGEDREMPDIVKLKNFKYKDYLKLMSNDLVSVVAKIDGRIIDILSGLKKIEGVCAEMTGAGSTLFALANNDRGEFRQETIASLKDFARERELKVVITKIL